MKYYIISGEVSGDLHGANLIKSIKKIDENAQFRVWGGDMMQNEGAVNVVHIKERAFMGFVEVFLNFFKIIKLIKLAKNDILKYQPDRLIFIDYPGFNLKIAAWANKKGFTTHYYISPKIWAWNTKRALKIKKIITKMYVILPFEKHFYKTFDYNVTYVGNPLIDEIENFIPYSDFLIKNNIGQKPIIALLPGSRRQEINLILPIMLNSVINYSDQYCIVLAVAQGYDFSYFDKFKNIEKVILIKDNTYNLLKNSYAAIVTSGTAALETAIFNVPQVVCYKTSFLNAFIAKFVLKVDFISLVNLIMNREVVKELLQNDLNEMNLKIEIDKILDTTNRNEILKSYKELKLIVGGSGASAKTAECIVYNKSIEQ
ncbi:MAG: lipid-A-disaccharide synthase [Bacteroidetes bacterium]|nr:lipid-A-disaccharide synthase [Bacteroidota bacterium]